MEHDRRRNTQQWKKTRRQRNRKGKSKGKWKRKRKSKWERKMNLKKGDARLPQPSQTLLDLFFAQCARAVFAVHSDCKL